MRPMFSSFELMQLKPTDRYVLIVFQAWHNCFSWNNHPEFLQKVRVLERTLKPLYTDLTEKQLSDDRFKHTKSYPAWRADFLQKIKDSKNYFSAGVELMGEIALIMRENGLLGGDDRSKKVIIEDDIGKVPPTDETLIPNEDDL